MARSQAIAEAGQTLVSILQEQIGDNVVTNPKTDIGLLSPGEAGGSVRLTLYLYRVTESGHLEQRATNTGTLRPAPIALELSYLLTAHPPQGMGDTTAKAVSQHEVLGRAIQVLQDNAILRGPDLVGSLASDQELQISMQSVNPAESDEILSLWNTFQGKPYRPSVSYLVSPVIIESERTKEAPPVKEKTEEYYSH